jgi:asparagine synthase (glutamine-hydrolysing)
MCGIAGFVTRGSQANIASVRAMCDQIVHRGPDDAGYHVDGRCGIGMRRLSIIDLSTGHQPIPNEDETVWVVFNGEVYNYAELRQDLIRKGHRFRTNSDTETLVHLYEEEGTEGLKKLRGMFAFAIWDRVRQRILVVRDRFGKKPVYYAVLPDGLYFGSEIQCLRVAGVPLDVDDEALKLYFHFSYVPDPWTAFRAIRKLPPGSWLTYDSSGRIEQGTYWKLPPPAEKAAPGQTPEQVRQQIRDKFDESVRIRMMADVPLGAFLSGGIDSSSVVASMALQSKEPVKTFSIGFKEPQFNELEWASLVAKKYNTDHHQIIVEPDSVSLVQKLVRHFGEPFADSSKLPTYIVSEFAARHVKVALTGDGGDELFAGYESFFIIQNFRKMDRVPLAIRNLMSRVADVLPYSAYGKHYLRMISRPTALERYFENNYAPHFLLKEMLTPEWLLPFDQAYITKTFAHCLLPDGADILSQALYFEATAKLWGDMLVKVDRTSMASSLEVRCPMLDHELADIAATVPHDWKLRNGKGKQIFIEAIGDRLPPELLTRKKMGFGVPLSLWFRDSLREFLWDHLNSSRFLNRGIVSPAFVKALLAEHDSNRRNNERWLWTLLILELWFREYEGQPEPLAAACEVEA